MSVWKRVRQYANESATQHHSRQSRARGNQSDQFARARRRQGTLSRRLHSRGNRLRLRLHPQRRQQAGVPGKIPEAPIRPASIPMCICKPSVWPTRPRCCAAKPRKCSAAFGRRSIDRDGPELARKHFRFFDTICGATQDRQDALRELLDVPMDLLLVIGGYNSSNTSHLAEMGEAKLPTYFVLNASRLFPTKKSCITNLHQKRKSSRKTGCLPADCHRHHRRRVLSEQPDRRNAAASLRIARHHSRPARARGLGPTVPCREARRISATAERPTSEHRPSDRPIHRWPHVVISGELIFLLPCYAPRPLGTSEA